MVVNERTHVNFRFDPRFVRKARSAYCAAHGKKPTNTRGHTPTATQSPLLKSRSWQQLPNRTNTLPVRPNPSSTKARGQYRSVHRANERPSARVRRFRNPHQARANDHRLRLDRRRRGELALPLHGGQKHMGVCAWLSRGNGVMAGQIGSAPLSTA